MRIDTLRLVHPFPSVLVAALTAAIVLLADRDAPLERYAILGFGMLMFQFAIGITNDVVDAEDDRSAKPWKPLARGDLSLRSAWALAALLVGAGLLLTLTLPRIAWAVGGLGLACGLVYDVWLKRTDWSWLPYSIALPLIPIWVYLASDRWKAGLWWALPLGAVLGFALHLANQAPDARGVTDEGLPGRIGERASRLGAIVLFGIVALSVVTLGLSVSTRSGVLVALFAGSVVAVSPFARRLGRDGLFGLLAVGSTGLALCFLILI